MRILYVTDALAIWGGLERILVEKMNYLAEEYGYEIYLSTSDQGDDPSPYLLSPKVKSSDLGVFYYRQYQYKGIKRIYVRYKLFSLYRRRLKKYVELLQPDIIICARLYLVSLVLKIKGDVPLLFESHSLKKTYSTENQGMLASIKMKYYLSQIRKTRMVVALTDSDAADWKSICNNVCTITNMVHLNTSGKYSDCSSKRAVFAGRFSIQKDMSSLIKIWAIVHDKFPEWELHIYGGYGEEQDCHKALNDNTNLNIIVHEPTSQIFEVYQKSSMLLLTSQFEPFGLVLPEAMSCGLPVVAFDCPYGPAEIITDGVDGFLIKDRDVLEYANKVCMLIDDISLRQKMGKAGILSSQRFSANIIMPKWKNLFEMIVKDNNN